MIGIPVTIYTYQWNLGVGIWALLGHLQSQVHEGLIHLIVHWQSVHWRSVRFPATKHSIKSLVTQHSPMNNP